MKRKYLISLLLCFENLEAITEKVQQVYDDNPEINDFYGLIAQLDCAKETIANIIDNELK